MKKIEMKHALQLQLGEMEQWYRQVIGIIEASDNGQDVSAMGVSNDDLQWLEAAADQFKERNNEELQRKLKYLEKDLIKVVTEKAIMSDSQQMSVMASQELIAQLEE